VIIIPAHSTGVVFRARLTKRAASEQTRDLTILSERKAKMTQTTRNSIPRRILVGGKWIESQSARFGSVTDPTTNEVIGRVPLCSKSDTDAAIEAAAKAFETWRDVHADRKSVV
jgi:hypothetical protein